MVESVRRTLFSPKPIGVLEPNREGWTVEHLAWEQAENQSRKRALNPSEGWRFLQGSGVVQGHLHGGCIEVADWLRGTAFWPQPEQWKNAILFLEISEDAPSPSEVQFYLRTYAALGILKNLSGILFGRPALGFRWLHSSSMMKSFVESWPRKKG